VFFSQPPFRPKNLRSLRLRRAISLKVVAAGRAEAWGRTLNIVSMYYALIEGRAK
jgi:hypothetical protein